MTNHIAGRPDLLRLAHCPACGADLTENRPAEHIARHSPSDFGL